MWDLYLSMYDISFFIFHISSFISYFIFHILYIYVFIHLSIYAHIHLFIYSSLGVDKNDRIPRKFNGRNPTTGGLGGYFSFFFCIYSNIRENWCQRYEAGDEILLKCHGFFRIQPLNCRGCAHPFLGGSSYNSGSKFSWDLGPKIGEQKSKI